MRIVFAASAMLIAVAATASTAAPFRLMTGVDAQHWPGSDRAVDAVPGPSAAGTFRDGDRLAGTSDVGGIIVFQGSGTPLHPPNHLGTLSFLFRRGSFAIPFTDLWQPILGIEFLGGPLWDLDGDLNNGSRSLVPVLDENNQPITPVEIPDTFSHIDLSMDLVGGMVAISGFDASGTSEGALNIDAGVATTLTTLAGTTPSGGNSGKINPAFDTRTGALTPFTGGGGLAGVYRIDGLQVELWFDTVLANSATADDLGTMQYFCKFDGWLVLRDCDTGLFPVLAGQGVGSTTWPAVDTSDVGNTFNTAINVFGPTATIFDGTAGDVFSIAGNGGVALIDAAGDLGAYFDNVVIPLIDPQAEAFVYLESAGFGTNNSGDPVFVDSDGFDAVVIAEAAAPIFPVGDVDGSGAVDLPDVEALINVLLGPSSTSSCELGRADVNQDGAANGLDIQALLDVLL